MNRLLTLVLAIATLASTTSFAAKRQFVASYGLNTNPCTLTEPCRDFAAANALVDQGGEIVVLDSAGYGPVTITKSLTITVPAGIYAGMSVSAGLDGIVVNVPGGHVRLEGISINGIGGNVGINVVSADTVVIERCRIVQMGGHGIYAVAGPRLELIDVASQRNGGNGFLIAGIGGGAHIAGSRFEVNSLSCIAVAQGANVSISTSSASANGEHGVLVSATSGFYTEVTAERFTSVNNAQGGAMASASGSGTAAIDVARSTLSRNGDGVVAKTEGVGAKAYITAAQNLITANSASGIVATGVSARIVATGNNVSRSTFGVTGVASGAVYSSGNAYAFNGTDVGVGVFGFSLL